MADLEAPRFSKRAVERSGKLLRGKIGAVDAEVLSAFEVAHNWRNAHVLPMRRLRAELSAKAKRTNPASVTAGRLKRMRSIRRKLARLPYTLYQMQDIAGCRAIVPSIADLEQVIESYERDARHERVGGDDYLAAPKRGGYRSHHQIYQFVGEGDEAVYRHQLIEVQVRTQLQHAWATAVEAVGLVRGEDLKGGEGNADWLRFFELMSSEFAAEEGCALVAGVPADPRERRQEIVALNAGLNAVVNLDSYIRLIHTTERMATGTGQIFMIQYDPRLKAVDVQSFTSYAAGARRYEQAESIQGSGIDTVLVEVDRAADLRSAYPNYYLDVGMFLSRLRDVVEGRQRVFTPAQPDRSLAVETSTATDTAPAITGRRLSFDLSWWYNRRRR